MGRNPQHIATGLEAVIDSAHAVTSYDVWVDTDDLAKALRTVRKLRGSAIDKPTVYPMKEETGRDDRVCLVL